jgi:dTDP-4-dehydrorhamnose reductase
MTNILVTGANGQVGQELQVLAPAFPDFRFTFVGRKQLDITDEKAVSSFFENHEFQYCINCAAYTAVDKAESEPEIAYSVNVTGVKNIAQACQKHKVHLFQLSTDYVYHGDQKTPFKETDPTNPQSIYAYTKRVGDEITEQINPLFTIIRTSWVYSDFGNNFVKTMLRLGNEKDELNIVADQIGTPTYAFDLAKAILFMIQKVENGLVGKEKLTGIFHYSNEGETHWAEFAKAIFRIKNIDCKVNEIATAAYPTPAKRPPFSVLDKTKIKETFGIEISPWEESLTLCLQKLNGN